MKNVKTACLIAALTGLYGCGGGGGGGGSTSMNLETAQGIWDSSSYSGTDLGKAIRSVMLKDGNAWVFLLDNLITNNPTPIGLVKASVAVSGQSFSGTGKRYMLDTHTGSSVEVQGNVPATQQLALKFGAAANRVDDAERVLVRADDDDGRHDHGDRHLEYRRRRDIERR